MTDKNTSTRRSFLKGSALAAAPLAMAIPAVAMASDETAARLARLEDEAAIRQLHQDWLLQINGGTSDTGLDEPVRSLTPDHMAQADMIEIAADGKRATGRFQCAVETETALAKDSTLAQMAHAQGAGFTRDTARRTLQVAYAKTDGTWAITKVDLTSA